MNTKITDETLNKCATDYYDTVMSESASIIDALDGALISDDMREEVGSLIMKIEKANGEDIQSKLKLANLIVNKTTDEAWSTAESYAADNAGDEL